VSAPHYGVVWHSPAPRQERRGISRLWSFLSVAPEREPALSQLGWVEVKGVETPKEELLALLTLGAEVEHTLLVQYLYAAASLNLEGSTNTQDLHALIRGIALQEMAHLISVQNLLLAVGGPSALHVGRDSIRAKSENNPLPFALEPVSDLTLSEYVLVEAPAVIPDPVADRIARMKLKVKTQAGIEPHRVGAFYTQVYWLLQPTDSPRGPLRLTPDPRGRKAGWHVQAKDFTDSKTIAAHQAQRAEWRVNKGPDMLILSLGDENTSREDLADIALQNVYAIMEQGEGAAPGENSHFDRFLAALDLFAQGGLSLLALPRTPYAGPDKPTEAPVTTPLQKPYTSLWAQLFDVRYTMLLLDIGLSLAAPFGSPDRGTLMTWAFGNMKPLLLGLIGQLSSQTLTAIEPCGPTFGLLYEDLPSGPLAPWQRYETLLERERKLVTDLEARLELGTDFRGKALLGNLKSNAAVRSKLVAQKLGAPTIG
jgi:hypothetical protein